MPNSPPPGEVAARRKLDDVRQANTRRLAHGGTLAEIGAALGETAEVDQTIEDFAARLHRSLLRERDRLDLRVKTRTSAKDTISVIQTTAAGIAALEKEIFDFGTQSSEIEAALKKAQSLRDDGLKVRKAVDTVRSAIIRREFNDRLNRLWRDLFVRLAPGEEFVPAFIIPDAGTQRLQPKLYTPHRDLGDAIAGGTPGAMLSAGNLNTAALTLFIALHLSVPAHLPWLILDDPVQSMDDIHIANFAALLCTLSKEHNRQVMLAVHDRQLFEYLRLELSPAFSGDSLITLELNRSSHRNTQCLATRIGYQEDTALRVA